MNGRNPQFEKGRQHEFHTFLIKNISQGTREKKEWKDMENAKDESDSRQWSVFMEALQRLKLNEPHVAMGRLFN